MLGMYLRNTKRKLQSYFWFRMEIKNNQKHRQFRFEENLCNQQWQNEKNGVEWYIPLYTASMEKQRIISEQT